MKTGDRVRGSSSRIEYRSHVTSGWHLPCSQNWTGCLMMDGGVLGQCDIGLPMLVAFFALTSSFEGSSSVLLEYCCFGPKGGGRSGGIVRGIIAIDVSAFQGRPAWSNQKATFESSSGLMPANQTITITRVAESGRASCVVASKSSLSNRGPQLAAYIHFPASQCMRLFPDATRASL